MLHGRRLIRAALPVALATSATLAGCALPPDAPTIIASAGGTGPDDAYLVYSVAQEYEVLRLLNLEMQAQKLHVLNGRPFDVLTARNVTSGEVREVWFDISRFFGRP